MMAHVFNPRIPALREAEAGGSEFEASLVYRWSSKTARATQQTLSRKKPNQTKTTPTTKTTKATIVSKQTKIPNTTIQKVRF